MEMITAVTVISCLVSSWRINHFGMNPVSGGRPAKDNRASIRVALRTGVFVQEVIIVESFRVLVVLRDKNTAAVIRTYK